MTQVKHSRQRAVEIVEKIPDHTTRKMALRSLGDHADMNLMVRTFFKVYGQEVVKPQDADPDFKHITKERLAMRFGLIVEEFMELCEAMDIRADIRFLYQDEEEKWKYAGEDISEEQHNYIDEEELHKVVLQRCQKAVEETDERSIVDIADATFDLKYVIIGFEYEIGIDPQFCALEGQASNLSKLGEDGMPIYRHDGKVMKGPNYFPPDMSQPLRAWAMKGV